MWFELGYQFLGGLGIFFFGMRNLSEALQSVAGELIRQVINALTSNRFMAVIIGALVTTLVQSSSVTTVMIVGLVNAGLMELTSYNQSKKLRFFEPMLARSFAPATQAYL